MRKIRKTPVLSFNLFNAWSSRQILWFYSLLFNVKMSLKGCLVSQKWKIRPWLWANSKVKQEIGLSHTLCSFHDPCVRRLASTVWTSTREASDLTPSELHMLDSYRQNNPWGFSCIMDRFANTFSCRLRTHTSVSCKPIGEAQESLLSRV